MRSAVVIEQVNGSYSAYVLDLPAASRPERRSRIPEREVRDAICFHIHGLKEDMLK